MRQFDTFQCKDRVSMETTTYSLGKIIIISSEDSWKYVTLQNNLRTTLERRWDSLKEELAWVLVCLPDNANFEWFRSVIAVAPKFLPPLVKELYNALWQCQSKLNIWNMSGFFKVICSRMGGIDNYERDSLVVYFFSFLAHLVLSLFFSSACPSCLLK